ncbi:MAG: 30S ribosomal protein S7 [bacterium]
MPRKALKPKERRPEPAPDFKYNSVLVSKIINILFLKGKKTVGERVFYKAMDQVTEKTKQDPLVVLTRAMDNIKPLLEVKARRVGGATYQVPVDVRRERQIALAIRWLIGFARERTGQAMYVRLAQEIIDASNKVGSAIKKREDTHKMAEANRAFAHYRW